MAVELRESVNDLLRAIDEQPRVALSLQMQLPAVREALERSPRGSYNCPICGWTTPHRKHADEFLEENSRLRQAWADLRDVRLEMKVCEQVSTPEFSVPRHQLQSWRRRIDFDLERLPIGSGTESTPEHSDATNRSGAQ